MKKFVSILFILLLYALNAVMAQESGITTVIIVRHAEKESVPESSGGTNMMQHDVNLTEAGENRAAKLADMLSKSNVSAVFSTNTTRTIETVNNYADRRGIKIIIYDDPDSLAENIKSNYRGRKILVSAHSNTIGPLLSAFGADSIPKIDHDYYSGFFVLTISAEGEVSLLHLEY